VVEGDSAPVEPLGAAAIQILGIGKARTLTQTLELDGGMEEPPEEMLSANIQAVKPHEDDDPDGDLAVRFEEPAEDSGPRVPRLTEAPPTPTHSPSVLTAEGILSTVAPPDLRSDLGNSELQRIVREAEESERRGKLREAVTFYGDALEHDPELVSAWLGRGRCLVELSDYGAAMSDFSRAEDLAPESPAPAIEMGNLFFVRKEYAKAISHFDQALQLQPQHALALTRRGTAHLHRKDQAAALADLQRAYKLDPNIPGLQRQLQAAQKKPAR
jgi:tetratricopeptide (TPR) repeat protein